MMAATKWRMDSLPHPFNPLPSTPSTDSSCRQVSLGLSYRLRRATSGCQSQVWTEPTSYACRLELISQPLSEPLSLQRSASGSSEFAHCGAVLSLEGSIVSSTRAKASRGKHKRRMLLAIEKTHKWLCQSKLLHPTGSPVERLPSWRSAK